jgi:hypothetical protein
MHAPTGRPEIGGFMRREYRLTLALLIFALALVAAAGMAAPAFAVGFVNTHSWATDGTAPGQLAMGNGMAVANGQLYVCDYNNNRVAVFTTDGAYVRQWAVANPAGIAVDATTGTVYVGSAAAGGVVTMFGPGGDSLGALNASGTGAQQTSSVSGVALDGNGNVYAADLGSNRIQVYSSGGAYLRTIGSSGAADGQFQYPGSVDLDSNGNVYVFDFIQQRVQKFTNAGAFLTKWGTSGSGTSQFTNAMFLTVGVADHVFVSDRGNDRIQEFTAAGSYVRSFTASGDTTPWGITSGPHDTLYGSRLGAGVKLFRWDYDDTPPVISYDYDGEWRSQPFTLWFSATDDYTLIPWLRWSTNGSDWTNANYVNVLAPSTHAYDGIQPLELGAGDAVSNWAYRNLHVKVDTRAPISTVSGVPSGWTNQEVYARVAATDVGSGVSRTFYELDGNGLTELDDTGIVPITTPGQHTLQYFSQDNCADTPNGESPKSVQVYIDQSGPTAAPVNNVSVRRGRSATFKYTLNDDWSATCYVWLVIMKKGKIVKTVALGVKASTLQVPPHAYSKKLAVGLAAGAYTWNVVATDLAGNAGYYAPKKLTVRP